MYMNHLPSLLDVVVVGAGAAGISAARTLTAHPLTIGIVEARHRVGGRAHTVHRAGMPLDIGCGWLHSADENPLAALASAEGLTLDKTPAPWEQLASAEAPEAAREFQAAFLEFERRVGQASASGDDGPASRHLDQASRWNARLDAISGALNGARLDQVSTRDYAAYRDTGVNWRVEQGYGRLLHTLAASLPVVTGCVVGKIDRSGPLLRLDTNLGAIVARVAIITASTELLCSERLRFEPPIPGLREAACSLPLGLASKLYLKLGHPEDLPAETQLWGRSDTAETGAYHLRPFGRALIEAWFSGDLARGLEREGEAAFTSFAGEELVNLLGSGIRRRLGPLATSMWGADPWALGAYSYARPGAGDARSRLATPVENRIFIAGEATSTTFYGSAHGAWLEGRRAGQGAVAALGLDQANDASDVEQ